MDHHSVSVAAIRTNPLAVIHHFVIGEYPNCPPPIVMFEIHTNDLLVFGSSGILAIHALVSSLVIPLNHVGVVGKLPLSI